jgi:hypothetical protein
MEERTLRQTLRWQMAQVPALILELEVVLVWAIAMELVVLLL